MKACNSQKKPGTDSAYFDEMTKAVFRSGFSWKVVEDKWPNFRSAFDNFEVNKVASYDERDVDRLLADEGIVRNGRKIEATINNARAVHEVVEGVRVRSKNTFARWICRAMKIPPRI